MKRLNALLVLSAAACSAAIGLASTAGAAPTGGSDAATTVKSLQDMGYTVALNGLVTAPLDECYVSGVHGLIGDRHDPNHVDTAYVDVNCPVES